MKTKIEKIDLIQFIVLFIALIITGCLCYEWYKTEQDIKQIETEINAQMEELDKQIVLVDSRVDVLNDDILELQESMEDIDSRLTTTRGVVGNTNKALIRTQKLIEEKEAEIQELRDELKKY